MRQRRLSLKQMVVGLATIGALLALLYLGVLFFLSNCGIQQNSAGEVLLGLAGDIRMELSEHGRVDLRHVRKQFSIKTRAHPLPLLWTEVELIRKDMEYDGQIICCVRRSYFGKLAMETMCIALERDPRRGEYMLLTRPLTGRPDFIREGRGAKQTASRSAAWAVEKRSPRIEPTEPFVRNPMATQLGVAVWGEVPTRRQFHVQRLDRWPGTPKIL